MRYGLSSGWGREREEEYLVARFGEKDEVYT
jgi:hypothetical protein